MIIPTGNRRRGVLYLGYFGVAGKLAIGGNVGRTVLVAVGAAVGGGSVGIVVSVGINVSVGIGVKVAGDVCDGTGVQLGGRVGWT